MAVYRHVCASVNHLVVAKIDLSLFGANVFPLALQPRYLVDFNIHTPVLFPFVLEYERASALWRHLRAKMGLFEVSPQHRLLWHHLQFSAHHGRLFVVIHTLCAHFLIAKFGLDLFFGIFGRFVRFDFHRLFRPSSESKRRSAGVRIDASAKEILSLDYARTHATDAQQRLVFGSFKWFGRWALVCSRLISNSPY